MYCIFPILPLKHIKFLYIHGWSVSGLSILCYLLGYLSTSVVLNQDQFAHPPFPSSRLATVPTPPPKNYPIQNVNGISAENP